MKTSRFIIVLVIFTILMFTPAQILTVFFVSDFAYAQIPIPNLQGTWQLSISGKDTVWNGQTEGMKDTGKLFIYQSPYESNVPNITVVPENDPEDPFQGFVQGNQVSFYKNNHHGDPNLGREMLVGKINKKGNSLTGKGIGFDSNTDWGSAWSYTFRAKKISDTVPPPPPEPTTYTMDCERFVGTGGTDPFDTGHANYTLVISGVVGSIATVGVEVETAGVTLAYLELRDESSNILATSGDATTSSLGWIEFTFSPAFVIDRTSFVLNFVADGSARVYNCEGTVPFIPAGLTAYALGQDGHMVRSYININP